MSSWDKMEQELARAHQAFCAYRDIGSGRSIHRVAAELRGERAGSKSVASGHLFR
jgi:uncharacterized protein YoaH (UPF0181 family)